MSEDFARWAPRAVGPYLYYDLGSTTIRQLMAGGVIPKRQYTNVLAKKPDSLLTYHSQVLAVIEHKTPAELSKTATLTKEIRDKSPAASALCNVLIITDDLAQTLWINPHTGEPILDESGEPIKILVDAKTFDNISDVDLLIQKAHGSVSPTNNTLSKELVIDPTPLAQRLWQSIWVATGKAPIKCLYNVVELFIFKFISDLHILPDDLAFDHIYAKSNVDPGEALQYYARNTRKRICELFPRGEDGTTIINGTIFVNEEGDANLSQSRLFQRSLKHLADYEQEFGRFTKIDSQFKTKLYETFLKQEIKALGQYFTPRVLVQSVIRMAGIDRPEYSFAGKRFCDPFCGVGGFLLEMLNLNPEMRDAYAPDKKGRINPGFTMHGFDKGFERDDERTIILAKANMLIYLAELLFKSPNASPEFAAIFNQTFTLFRDNLGTFGHIVSEDDRYDTILSNPPYVTNGTSIMKQEIADSETLKDFYTINALGLESISIEWIVKSLRPGGQAYVIIPDGILGRIDGKKLRDFMLDTCFVDAIVSLPPRTFFSNSERTYILALTRKHNNSATQNHPVFTYLVSAIGEQLTSVRRATIADNDLPEMERLFHQCRSQGATVDRKALAPYPRCKLIEVTELRETHWVIDRRWTNEEKVALGIESSVRSVSNDELSDALSKLREAGEQLATARAETENLIAYTDYSEHALGDKDLFTMQIGVRAVRQDLLPKSPKAIPVYSSNVHTPRGYLSVARAVTDYSRESLIWGIDGNFDFNLISAGTPFDVTDHCGRLQIQENVNIDPRFLLYQLRDRIASESYDRSFRAALAHMEKFSIQVPIDEQGNFDLAAQAVIADHHERLEGLVATLVEAKNTYDELFGHFAATSVQTLSESGKKPVA